MPKRADLRSVLVIGSGPIVIGQACEFDYSGTQACRVLARGGRPRHPGQLQPGHDHDRPRVRRRHLRRADHPGLRRAGHREGTPRRPARHPRRPDRAEHRDGAGRERRPREVRRAADRRLGRGHRARREPGILQAGRRDRRWRGGPQRRLPHPRRLPCRGGRTRLPDGRPAVVHDGRRRLRDGLHTGRPRPDRRRRPGCQPDQRGAAGGVDHRLEGVRTRGDARHRRQRGDRLLHRERRPDGRAHRRLDHRGPCADADRPRVPAPARPLDRDHPRGRRRDRRLQHPVRRQPGRRSRDRHRDEPAGVALLGAGQQGDRLPDRQDRREGRPRLHPRRDRQRHHRGERGPQDPGELRADARLRGRQGAAVRIREVPGRRPDPHHPHEERRRGDGHRPQLHRGAAEGAALARTQGRVVLLGHARRGRWRTCWPRRRSRARAGCRC